MAIRDEMIADSHVVVFGEDVAAAGGVFKVTDGLLTEFGPSRVRDTPISETAIVGAALGAAALGLRPVAEIMFAEFFGTAFDQVVTECAKFLYLSGGRTALPVVFRAASGGGFGFGAQHSQTLESWFMGTPGLVVVSPSGASAGYSLLRAAIRSDNPVVFLEPKALYGVREEFRRDSSWELGQAKIVRPGSDVTVVALGRMVQVALDAAKEVVSSVDAEIIDLGTILPWDRGAVAASLQRTGRLVTVEEAPRTAGWGADIAAAAGGEFFGALRAPVTRVTCPDAPVPHSPPLEAAYVPRVDDVVDALREAIKGRMPEDRWNGWRQETAVEEDLPPIADLRRREALTEPIERLARMTEIRECEEAIQKLYSEGLVAGTTHLCMGQEAVAVGVAAATRATDVITCTYRGHGFALALGVTLDAVLGETLGRACGTMRGKGGSMHLAAPEIGLLPTFAVVGAGIPVAVGAAAAFQINEQDRAAIAVFGDGATNIGAFHEALNLASVWKLPVVFVCENNLYGEYSPIDRTTAVVDIADRACAYAIPSVVVDGQDLESVCAAVSDAVATARSGEGPTLLEMKTYRYSGHSRGDPASYRAPGELESWLTRDPIRIYRNRLLELGTWNEQEIAGCERRVREDVSAAVTRVLAAPRPNLNEILLDVRLPLSERDRWPGAAPSGIRMPQRTVGH